MLRQLKQWIRCATLARHRSGGDLRAALRTLVVTERRNNTMWREKCRFTEHARIINHSNEPHRIRLGRGVILDGTLACHPRGTLTVGTYTFVGRSRIYCTIRVDIGSGVLISDNVAIMDSDMHPFDAGRRYQLALDWAEDGIFPDVYKGIINEPVTIEDSAWIGFCSCIIKGVKIGCGSIVAAGSVVTTHVDDWTVVAGNPAHIVRVLSPDERGVIPEVTKQ